MAIYEYKGLDLEGKSKAGIVDADNPKVARAKLRKSGIFPVEITQTQQAAPTGLSKPVTLFSERMTLAETAVMTRQLSTLLGAGISLMEALGALTEQVEKPAAKKIWIDVREGVKEGASLADALARHPKVFSVLYRQMVRAGEASGTLDRILVRLADYLESQVRLRNKLFSILTYPVLMLFVSGAILIFLISFVVPKVTGIFADLKQALPLPTVILLALSDFLRGYGWLLIGAGILGGMIYRRHIQTPRGREQYDRLHSENPAGRKGGEDGRHLPLHPDPGDLAGERGSAVDGAGDRPAGGRQQGPRGGDSGGPRQYPGGAEHRRSAEAERSFPAVGDAYDRDRREERRVRGDAAESLRGVRQRGGDGGDRDDVTARPIDDPRHGGWSFSLSFWRFCCRSSRSVRS
ncbi:MAG: type II secretion system F family protein [Candidatus Manganitrophus sp.]|nr:type II secretion system F family protein [Candidatus Manganitrophus sp.]